MGNKLSFADNSIRIGSNIDYVKVNGQTQVFCSTTGGNRYVRIRRVRGSNIKEISWGIDSDHTCSQFTISLSPIIVDVQEDDLIQLVFYSDNSSDTNRAGGDYGDATYLTVEEV